MIEIDNEFIVAAQNSEVWDVITQVNKYGEWNSFVSHCESTLVPGESILMRVHLLPIPINQKETIFEYQPGVILSYGVKLPFNLLNSTRTHTVTNLENERVRYRSSFRLNGILAPLVRLIMAKKLTAGFSKMAHEMQAEVLRRQH